MRKKIAFLISALDEGGMGRVLEMLSMGIPDEKYEQYIILLIKNRSINYKFKGTLLCLGEESNNVFGKTIIFINRIKKLAKLKEKYNFDIVLSFGANKNFINYFTKFNEKIIMSQHNVASIEHKSWGWYGKLNDLFLKVYNKSDALISVSRYVQEDLSNHYKIKNDKMIVIYNGLDIEAVRSMSKENVDLGFMQNKVNLICVARLAESKGIWHALKIMPIIRKKIRNIQLIIIGDGVLREWLEQLSVDLGINDITRFLGSKKNPFPYVSQSDLFLFPSIYEGFGMSYLEAMSLGVPVVATDCKAGPREVLAGNANYCEMLTDVYETEYGVLIPPLSPFSKNNNVLLENEEKIFAKAVLNLLQNRNKMHFYKKKSLERCEEFSQEHMVNQYVQLFQSLT